VMSETYRQSSKADDKNNADNPNNQLLAHQNIRRLEAEFIRDNILAVSGLLNADIGGTSNFPYQPGGYFQQLSFPKRMYYATTGEKQYRRGLYTHWQRTLLHPSMQAFGAPSREECVAKRPMSNTPMQAMTLLNDPSYLEAARVLAARVLTKSGAESFSDRLTWLFQKTLNREYYAEEGEHLQIFYESELARFSANKEAAENLVSIGNSPDAVVDSVFELAAWASVSRVVLNLHETYTKY
jgi:hypothetical protein